MPPCTSSSRDGSSSVTASRQSRNTSGDFTPQLNSIADMRGDYAKSEAEHRELESWSVSSQQGQRRFVDVANSSHSGPDLLRAREARRGNKDDTARAMPQRQRHPSTGDHTMEDLTTPRSSSPFVMVSHREKGGQLKDEEWVDPVMIQLQKEREMVREKLQLLRQAEDVRRRCLWSKRANGVSAPLVGRDGASPRADALQAVVRDDASEDNEMVFSPHLAPRLPTARSKNCELNGRNRIAESLEGTDDEDEEEEEEEDKKSYDSIAEGSYVDEDFEEVSNEQRNTEAEQRVADDESDVEKEREMELDSEEAEQQEEENVEHQQHQKEEEEEEEEMEDAEPQQYQEEEEEDEDEDEDEEEDQLVSSSSLLAYPKENASQPCNGERNGYLSGAGDNRHSHMEETEDDEESDNDPEFSRKLENLTIATDSARMQWADIQVCNISPTPTAPMNGMPAEMGCGVHNSNNASTTVVTEPSPIRDEADLDSLRVGGFLTHIAVGDTSTYEFVLDKEDEEHLTAFRKAEYELRQEEYRLLAQIEERSRVRLANGTHFWQSNESVNRCPRCNKTFSLIVRKHHCRRCGTLLCNDCCSQVGRDMYASVLLHPDDLPEAYPIEGEDAGSEAETFLDDDTRDFRPSMHASGHTTPRVGADEGWMYDTCNLTLMAEAGASLLASNLSALHAPSAAPTHAGGGETQTANQTKRTKRQSEKVIRGRGGLQVRSAPWCRICNRCYLICYRARLQRTQSRTLEDGRRPFYVLNAEEQSILSFGNEWETRFAQMDVLKHLVMERSVSTAKKNLEYLTTVFFPSLLEKGYATVQNLRLRGKEEPKE